MTKNRSMKIAVLVLALALITACFVGTTFAKYTSTATGSSTGVQVAKWAWSGVTIDASNNTATVDFDIFETILDTKDGATETDVDAKHIAPGTKGEASFTLVNNSEVNATYDFTLDTTAFAALADKLTFTYYVNDAPVAADAVEGTLAMKGGSAKIDVAWEWAFEVGADQELKDNDLADTLLGLGATDTDMVATATVVLTQVD